MKIRAALFSFLFFFLLFPTAFSQGPLTPPGAPAPTFKTLDQVEPRKPIGKLPFTIGTSGSYYLTANLQFTAASGNAITITVSNVTLDLMGFTLSSTGAVTGDAIRINAGLRNIAVRNGGIAGNTTVTISGSFPNKTWTVKAAGFSYGINSSLSPRASDCHFSQLRISGCRLDGLNGGDQAVAEQVTATQNGEGGIVTSASNVFHCTAISNGAIGISGTVVTHCIANANQSIGILAFSGSVNNCTAIFNGSTGVLGTGSNIANCIAKTNEGRGITASSVANCTADSNDDVGIEAFSVINSQAISNKSDGISAGSGSVTNSTAKNNTSDGISVSNGSVTNSTALNNGHDGIFAADSVVAFCKSFENNTGGTDGVDIHAANATRTGNKPTP